MEVLTDQEKPIVRVRVSTAGIEAVDGGLPISQDHEEVVISFDARYPDIPPTVAVEHDRWVDEPHVLAGRILCLYLDVSREWHPTFGPREVLERLWEFLEDGAANRFDRRAALFPAFGGINPVGRTRWPTVVVRASPPNDGKALSLATLRWLTPARLDLVAWRGARAEPPDEAALVMSFKSHLPTGLERTLVGIVGQATELGGPALPALHGALRRAAEGSKSGTPIYLVVTAPNPADPSILHLQAGRIRAEVADLIRCQGPAGSARWRP